MVSDDIEISPALDPGIYRAINPLDLPRLTREQIISGSVSGIYVESDDPHREFFRYPAAFVDDPDQVGLFGQSIDVTAYWYPPIFAASITDATLVGYRTILTRDNYFFTDEGYVDEEVLQHQLQRISRGDPFSNEMTGLGPTDRETYFKFNPRDRRCITIEGDALVLCSDEPFSYGSFLFRTLTKVRSVRDLGLTDLPCLVYAENQSFMDLLSLAGVPASKIRLHDVNAVTKIERAIMPAMRNPHAYLDPESCEFYAELRESFGARPSGRKIYVSRYELNRTGRGASRIMVNEAALIARLEAMGFQTIEPENLTVADQIKAFSSASIVVGPSGSGLFNVMFCHPGTKVIDIQSEPHWIYSYTGMYSSLQLDYGIFVGKPDPEDNKPVHREFTVNVDALAARAKAFISEANW
jgi:capsular polysaccharide biosynthesis protein